MTAFWAVRDHVAVADFFCIRWKTYPCAKLCRDDGHCLGLDESAGCCEWSCCKMSFRVPLCPCLKATALQGWLLAPVICVRCRMLPAEGQDLSAHSEPRRGARHQRSVAAVPDGRQLQIRTVGHLPGCAAQRGEHCCCSCCVIISAPAQACQPLHGVRQEKKVQQVTLPAGAMRTLQLKVTEEQRESKAEDNTDARMRPCRSVGRHCRRSQGCGLRQCMQVLVQSARRRLSMAAAEPPQRMREGLQQVWA